MLKSILLILVWTLCTAVAGADSTRLTVAGEGALNGIFDPSIEMAPGASEGWLAYSAVFGNVSSWGPHVEATLASTTDGGVSFTRHGVVNTSQFATITLPDQTTVDGVWNYETSSLVYVPDDVGAEWKLFSHRVFRKTKDNFTEEQNLPAYSWIVLRSAGNPSGLWSEEIALLSSGPFPPAPYDNVQVSINEFDTSLASLIVYSEPGAFYLDGVLYLSLTGLSLTGPDRIILLASDDHGLSWRYVGTPLLLADATALGFVRFDGSAIASQGSRVFLLTTPESPGILHDGTLVIEFEDIASASVVRNAGVPVVEKHLPALPGLPADRRGGQADYHESFVNGVVMPSLQLDDFPAFFAIFSTGESLAAPPVLPSMGVGAGLASVFLIGLSARFAMRRRRV